MPLTVFIFLRRELWFAASEEVVRDVTVDLVFVQIPHVGFVGEASIADLSPKLTFITRAHAVMSNTKLFATGKSS